MCDYKNGKIYQLVCNDTGEVYIGSTTSSLEDRLNGHIYAVGRHSCTAKQIIDRDNFYIEILETYPCNNEHELHRKEGEYQLSMKCINHNIAGRTIQEWRLSEHGQECVKGHNKAYHNTHKEELLKKWSIKINCQCGSTIRNKEMSRHLRTKKHLEYIAKLT